MIPSIYPSIFHRLVRVGSQPKQGSPDFPILSFFVQLFLIYPKAFLSQLRDMVSTVRPKSSWGPPIGGTCPEHLTK